MYALYKQATVGDCNAQKPPLYEFVNKSKWEAWNSLKGMTTTNAMKNYIGLSVQVDCHIPKIVKSLLGDDS